MSAFAKIHQPMTYGEHKESQDVSVPPTAGLWTAIAETPEALEIVTKGKKGATRRKILEQYLATSTIQAEIGADLEISDSAVGTMVSRTLVKVFPLLPENTRTVYGSPEQALKTRKAFSIEATNVQRGQSIEAGIYTGQPLGRRPGSAGRKHELHLQTGTIQVETRQKEQQQFEKAKKLHEQLEASGAYKNIRDRRSARLLKVYLSTDATLDEAGKNLDRPLKSSRVHDLIYSGMQQAFPHLDEQTRQEYGTPEAALKARTQANVIQSARRGHAALAQAIREGTVTEKTLGGARSGAGRPRNLK